MVHYYVGLIAFVLSFCLVDIACRHYAKKWRENAVIQFETDLKFNLDLPNSTVRQCVDNFGKQYGIYVLDPTIVKWRDESRKTDYILQCQLHLNWRYKVIGIDYLLESTDINNRSGVVSEQRCLPLTTTEEWV